MRLAEVNTVGEALAYCENYETSMDNYDIVKESYEINLMEIAMDLTDGLMLESEEDKTTLRNTVAERKSNLLKKMLDALKSLIAKVFSAINKMITDTKFKKDAKLIEKNIDEFLLPEEGSELTIRDRINRVNSDMAALTIKLDANDGKTIYFINRLNREQYRPISELSEYISNEIKTITESKKRYEDDVVEWTKMLNDIESKDADPTLMSKATIDGIRKSIDDATKAITKLGARESAMFEDIRNLSDLIKVSK